MRFRWTAILLLLLGCSSASVLRTTPNESLEGLAPGSPQQFFYPSAAIHAEAYLVRPRGAGPFPVIVFLHGHSWRGSGARRMVPVAEIFARDLCYAGLAVSLPGYGETPRGNGSLEDATRGVVLDAVQAAKRLSWIDAERIYVYGFSRGAAVAVALANEIPGVRAVLLHSGAYDLTRLYEETSSFWLRVMLNPKGDEKPRFQDLLADVREWRFSTLLLHGERDSLVPFSQAVLLRDRLASLNKTHRLVGFPEHGHRLPIHEIKAEASKFLRESGGSACALSDP